MSSDPSPINSALFKRDSLLTSPNSIMDLAEKVLTPPTVSSEDLNPCAHGGTITSERACTFEEAASEWEAVLTWMDELERVWGMISAFGVHLTKLPTEGIEAKILREGTQECLAHADALLREARLRVAAHEKDIVDLGGTTFVQIMARLKLEHARRKVEALTNEQNAFHEQMFGVMFRSP